jgi:hypothetical protein
MYSSAANPEKHVAKLILTLQAGINSQRISTSRYNSGSRTPQAANTVIVACRAPLPHIGSGLVDVQVWTLVAD